MKSKAQSEPGRAMSELAEILGNVYSQQAIPQILEEMEPLLVRVTSAYPSTPDWYKKCNLYVTYPDSFCRNGQCDLFTLAGKVEYLEQLGINALHILPFLDSPMVDLGFDISDYRRVREELGGNEAFRRLLRKAQQANIRVFIDLVLNHVSEKHHWYQRAVAGDVHYRQFFIHKAERPNVIRTEERENGLWAVYETAEGTTAHRIIFPEFAGEVPHWRQGKDGYWYYHTFYPQQLDLDWMNPEVFVAFAKILAFWLRYDVSFRLDAVTFIAKDIEEGPVESNPRLHFILQALNVVVKQISPGSVFLVESCQPLSTIKKYFGEQRLEAELAYNFNVMNDAWSAILNADPNYVWRALESTHGDLPPWAAWINFLRNHDELTLEFAPQEQRLDILRHLEPYGKEFREGFGVAGRTASFLQEDERRIKMAYLLLASLPGSAAIIYGDEIGKTNDPAYIQQQVTYKEEVLGFPAVDPDARDLNRGKIAEADLQTERAQRIYQGMSRIFTTRLDFIDHFARVPARIEAPSSIFAAEYRADGEKLYIYVNLSSSEKEIDLPQALDTVELRINDVSLSGNVLVLGPYAGVWFS